MIVNIIAFLTGTIFLLLPFVVITDFHTGEATETLVIQKKDYWLLVGLLAGFCWGVTSLCLIIIDIPSFKPNYIIYDKHKFSILESIVFLIKTTVLGSISGLLLGLFISFLDKRKIIRRNNTSLKT